MRFKPVNPKPNFPKMEEKILCLWKEKKIFEKSVRQRSKKDLYVFYDGPPFVTGQPHYGHLVGSIAKDVIPRYFTMKGKRVSRVWGWDCHGLPIENKVEEKIGLKNRREILKFGVNKFIDQCRTYVEKVSSEWQWYIDHIGRWVDFKNSYRTMDLDYMETVIWVFKQLYDKGLIYKGNRVSLFCPRCSTPVSNFEIAMDDSYAMIQDPAITVKFAIRNSCLAGRQAQFANSYILAWTTTPWTLPSNRALVVDEDEIYIQVKIEGEKDQLVLAKKRLKACLGKKKLKIMAEFKGRKLLGLAYEPLYTFFPANEKDFKIYSYKNMVNMDEGTGIVHSAPGFGEIDTEMGKHFGLTMTLAVNDEGRFIDQVTKWAGVYVKDADRDIIKDLNQRGWLFKKEIITHRYPFCYRCETLLIYKAQKSWFLNIQKLKKQLLKTNQKINWVPAHFKYGRFKKGIETAPDWCLSRTRYWATIMPVWQCQNCSQIKVVGSIAEIEKLSGQKVTDLHRPGADNLKFKCENCGGVMGRIPEVLDCWMESGSMPYAQVHYPFENKKEFEKSFPADYIVEYTGQVRAWFYVMHVIANALMKSHCFKNVVVTGVMAGTDGRKMSKSFANFPDPKIILKKYGGDALRLYLMGSVIMLGEDMNITKGEAVEEQVKTVLLPLWNCYKFFVTFANLKGNKATRQQGNKGNNILNKWILSRLNQFNQEFSHFMDSYHLPQAIQLIRGFIDDLSKWYIRRSREKFSQGDQQALETLYYVLLNFSKMTAPIIPFISEEIYQNLNATCNMQHATRKSVHLEDWPEAGKVDRKLLEDIEQVRKICELGHAERKRLEIRVRQPLAKLKTQNSKLKTTTQNSKLFREYEELIKDELNVKQIEWVKGKGDLKVELDIKLTPELKAEGETRELVRKIQNLRKKARCKLDEKIIVYAPSWPKEFEKYILDKTLAKTIRHGKALKIEFPCHSELDSESI